LQSAFEILEVKFSERVDKEKLRVVGIGRFGAVVELVGPEENQTRATVRVLANQSEQATEWYNVYMLGLLTIVAPDWTESPQWLAEGLASLAAGENLAQTRRNEILIRLEASPDIGVIVLTVAAGE
jgi:hypothetical protein